MHHSDGTRCLICDSPIDQPAGKGRPRIYCKNTCSTAAWVLKATSPEAYSRVRAHFGLSIR